MTQIVILAAGKGMRMHSSLPKVVHKLAGKALVQHVIDTSAALDDITKVILVVGHGAEQVKARVFGDHLYFVEQNQQLGTGHAVLQALSEINEEESILILYGDVPLIGQGTLNQLLQLVSDNSMGLLTVILDDPSGYGRIIRDDSGQIIAIVEQKDATEEQLAINEINTGVMAIKGKYLKKWLPTLSNNNAQGEYYLTDLIAIAKQQNIQIATLQPDSAFEVAGVNNRIQQAELEREYQSYQARELMISGLTITDPARFDLRGQLVHGNDCSVDINCVFEGKNSLGNNVTIGPNCLIKNAKILDNAIIEANTHIDGAIVGPACVVGPYARLRPGTELKSNAKIGNFVETKKAFIGEGSKVNHLSYVGDAQLGERVNIGAGTITCNYDGVNKSKTIIGDDVFVGSNTALVAPVCLGEGSTVGAGSVVNKDAGEKQLVVARAKQRNIDGWERPTKK